MEMFNDLRSDPKIREHYQFWFYLYPSGQPFWQSAAEMREDLVQMRAKLDPQRRSPALDQTILVGHSMGGLVSKLQTVDSGNEFWRTLTDKPFAELQADPEIRDQMAATFFFDPNPSIRRVVTIGTPHRGSEFSNDFSHRAILITSAPRRQSTSPTASTRSHRSRRSCRCCSKHPPAPG
jgi:triacylglycerol esterase/lipase EstA (alpha/beta hydrolase family)